MESKNVIAALAALAQESRLGIFRLLVEAGPEGLSVGRIGESLGLTPATMSFHLKELSRAGLIEPRQEGRFIFYSANFLTMNELLGFLTENCCGGKACCSPAPDAHSSTEVSIPAAAAKPKSRSPS